jgi:hypothetical protein
MACLDGRKSRKARDVYSKARERQCYMSMPHNIDKDADKNTCIENGGATFESLGAPLFCSL